MGATISCAATKSRFAKTEAKAQIHWCCARRKIRRWEAKVICAAGHILAVPVGFAVIGVYGRTVRGGESHLQRATDAPVTCGAANGLAGAGDGEGR